MYEQIDINQSVYYVETVIHTSLLQSRYHRSKCIHNATINAKNNYNHWQYQHNYDTYAVLKIPCDWSWSWSRANMVVARSMVMFRTLDLRFFCRESLEWRHNGRDGVSNHQPHDCLLNRSFRCRSKKTSKLCVTGLCTGNSPDNSSHKWPVMRKMFPFDDVIMVASIDPSHSASHQYTTMHHFLTEMRTFLLQNGAFWDWWDGSIFMIEATGLQTGWTTTLLVLPLVLQSGDW